MESVNLYIQEKGSYLRGYVVSLHIGARSTENCYIADVRRCKVRIVC